jgi:hypothetical protein
VRGPPAREEPDLVGVGGGVEVSGDDAPARVRESARVGFGDELDEGAYLPLSLGAPMREG